MPNGVLLLEMESWRLDGREGRSSIRRGCVPEAGRWLSERSAAEKTGPTGLFLGNPLC